MKEHLGIKEDIINGEIENHFDFYSSMIRHYDLDDSVVSQNLATFIFEFAKDGRDYTKMAEMLGRIMYLARNVE